MASPTPLSISVTPVKTVLPAGQLRATEHVTITDAGRQPLTVTAIPATVTQAAHGCGVGGASGHWMTLSTHSFRLSPGQAKTVTVKVRVPRSATGTHDLTAVFTAHAREADANGGNVTVTGAVGSQFVVTATGRTHAPVCAAPHHRPPLAASAHAGGTSPAGGLILLAVLVAAAGAAVAGVTRRRRRRSSRRRSAAHAR